MIRIDSRIEAHPIPDPINRNPSDSDSSCIRLIRESVVANLESARIVEANFGSLLATLADSWHSTSHVLCLLGSETPHQIDGCPIRQPLTSLEAILEDTCCLPGHEGAHV